MSQQLFFFYMVIIITTTRSIKSYQAEKEYWDDCKYPVGLWYCIVVITFNINLLLTTILYICRSQDRYKYILASIPILIQLFFFVWNVIGTFWIGLTIYKDASCVMFKQLPEAEHNIILEMIGSYFLWVLDSIVVLFVVVLITVREPITSFDRGDGLSEETIAKIKEVPTGDNLTCGICLENVIQGTLVKELPECLHQFHVDCVDEWLRRRAICPYCRCEITEIN